MKTIAAVISFVFITIMAYEIQPVSEKSTINLAQIKTDKATSYPVAPNPGRLTFVEQTSLAIRKQPNPPNYVMRTSEPGELEAMQVIAATW